MGLRKTSSYPGNDFFEETEKEVRKDVTRP